MRRLTRSRLVALAVTAPSWAFVASSCGVPEIQGLAPAPNGIERLRTHIAQAVAETGGRVGIAIKHLETGAGVTINADEKFPMASAIKLPVLLTLYDQARKGVVSWNEAVDVGVYDQHLGTSDLSSLYDVPGIRLSLHNVANLMMIVSDSSSADICLRRAGRERVNAVMTSIGATGIHIDRSMQELILDYQGRDTGRLKGLTLGEIQASGRPPDTNAIQTRFARDDKFADDPRDQASPREFMVVLERLWRAEIVDRISSDAILDTMKRCKTGPGRLRGLLPPSTIVAHKTGTLGGVVNDIGIIYLPDTAGHVAVVAMSKRTRTSEEEVERSIAQVARYAYDYFTFSANEKAKCGTGGG